MIVMWRSLTVLFICLVVVFPSVSVVAAGGGDEYSPPKSGLDVQEPDQNNSGEDQEDENDGFIASVKELVANIKRLITGEAVMEMFNKWIAAIFDNVLKPVINALGSKAFLLQPDLQDQKWVYAWWSWSMWISLALLGPAFLVTGLNVLKGKELAEPLKALGIAIFFTVFTMTIVDFVIKLVNYAVTMSSAELLQDLSQKLGYQINMQTIDGITAMKLIFEGAFVDDTSASLATVMLNAGGILYVMIGTILIFLLALVSVLKTFGLDIIVIGAPAWFTIAAIFGKTETVIGWMNLALRTIFLGVIFNLGWLMMVSITNSSENGEGIARDLGIAPSFINLVIMAVLLVLAYRFWLTHMVVAIVQPLSLGGSTVMDRLGRVGEKTSGVMNRLSQRFGWTGMERMSHKVNRASAKSLDKAQKWKSSAQRMDAAKRDWEEKSKNSSLKKWAGRMDWNPDIKFPSVQKREASPLYHDRSRETDSAFQFQLPPDEQLVNSISKELEQLFEQKNMKRQQELEKVNKQLEKLRKERSELSNQLSNRMLPDTIRKKKQSQLESLEKQINDLQYINGKLRRQVEAEHHIQFDSNKVILKAQTDDKGQVENIIKKAIQNKIPYWKKGQEVIVVENGLPVNYGVSPPVNGIYMGKWKQK
ncbi:MAG: hypothetical protein H0Z33_11150 [Bacillaceae bacterium]|nr:hypothetical protein [Bacillaceae bacterium]